MPALSTIRRAAAIGHKAFRPTWSEYRSHVAAHKRALAAPMVGCPMVGDPYNSGSLDLPGFTQVGAELMTRRAIQYAAELARRDGREPGAFNARYLGAGRVHFFDGRGAEFEVVIPERIMTFDPTAAPLMIEGPEIAQEGPAPAERCKDTPDMLEASPAPALAIMPSVSTPAELGARKVRRSPKPKAAMSRAQARFAAAREAARPKVVRLGAFDPPARPALQPAL